MVCGALTGSDRASGRAEWTHRFAQAEAGEHLPGGSTTHRKRMNKDAFSHASANQVVDPGA
jgi:CxxC motif-containing protein (DUF1111 family)